MRKYSFYSLVIAAVLATGAAQAQSVNVNGGNVSISGTEGTQVTVKDGQTTVQTPATGEHKEYRHERREHREGYEHNVKHHAPKNKQQGKDHAKHPHHKRGHHKADWKKEKKEHPVFERRSDASFQSPQEDGSVQINKQGVTVNGGGTGGVSIDSNGISVNGGQVTVRN